MDVYLLLLILCRFWVSYDIMLSGLIEYVQSLISPFVFTHFSKQQGKVFVRNR